MRPFWRARLLVALMIVAVAIGTGAAIASAAVHGKGNGPGSSGHEPSGCGNANGWASSCPAQNTKPAKSKPKPNRPTTSTTTTTTTTTTIEGAPFEAPDPALVVAALSDLTSASGGSSSGAPTRASAVPVAPRAQAPAAVAPATALTPRNEPVGAIPRLDELFGNPAGIPFAMALVIALAAMATVGFVVRGSFGRRTRALGLVDEGESLTFH